ncbi:hypothetical protein FHX44_117711 [Pseudonocardia hierapolitana]|uniref:Uncharacterized protein n=1 Tax=Pseudonocardia hierapolitana TaxID=1128676 RepID=A0A561T3T7_9PSEU|nr:hypothetical protein [Pseudonocardia hierapolitana]TWF81766.1 hypothetical protein FHX44_117711 [Pseudonocardia hierapolitana]
MADEEATTRIATVSRPEPPPDRLGGSTAATLLASGIGCAAFGIAVVAAESLQPVKQLFTLSTAVGPLSGKAVVAVVIYLLAWAALFLACRRRTMPFAAVLRVTAVLIGIGVVGTFPPFYGLVAGH